MSHDLCSKSDPRGTQTQIQFSKLLLFQLCMIKRLKEASVEVWILSLFGVKRRRYGLTALRGPDEGNKEGY